MANSKVGKALSAMWSKASGGAKGMTGKGALPPTKQKQMRNKVRVKKATRDFKSVGTKPLKPL